MAERREAQDVTLDGGEALAATLRTGTLFAGRYDIVALLGRGGMGAVYRATDTLVGDPIALKTLDSSAIANASSIERFRREVRLARRITHPNVARTHDLGEHGGVHFLTMELVEGTNLQELIEKERTLAPVRAARIGLSIAEGLSAAHAAGVVHRDLKPANVLVESSGRVVVTDFGIARSLEQEAGQHRTVGTVGTPLYMSPEQVQGLATDARSDLYALGLVLAEMLTGRVPFQEDTPIATAIARLQREPPDPRESGPVPDVLADLVLRCLARDPQQRVATAQTVAEVLRAYVEDHQGSRASMPLPITPAPRAPTQPGATPKNKPITFERALAVLPFVFRGPADQAYLGDALTEELIDVLSRTRGLRVLGSGAVGKFRGDRDPRHVAAELAVDAIVDATVQMAGQTVRVAARLVDVKTGTQLWNERFEGGLEDVFVLQDTMSKRIAEALRVSLATVVHRGEAPPEAIELYLRARQKISQLQAVGPDGALELLERAIELAPTLRPALAAHALATIRAWFLPVATAPRDWRAQAEASVARALEQAEDLAETHLAAAMLHVNLGAWREAVAALRQALLIAPTCAPAHQYLGQLQCEAGRPEEGLKHLTLALELDPTLRGSWIDIARVHALHGRWDEYDRAARALDSGAVSAAAAGGSAMMRVRTAVWRRDEAALRRTLDEARRDGSPFSSFVAHYASVALGEAVQGSPSLPVGGNPRFLVLLEQYSAEALASAGELDAAAQHVARAVELGLFDLGWMDLCPSIAPLRGRPEWADLRRQVRDRADAIFTS